MIDRVSWKSPDAQDSAALVIMSIAKPESQKKGGWRRTFAAFGVWSCAGGGAGPFQHAGLGLFIEVLPARILHVELAYGNPLVEQYSALELRIAFTESCHGDSVNWVGSAVVRDYSLLAVQISYSLSLARNKKGNLASSGQLATSVVSDAFRT